MCVKIWDVQSLKVALVRAEMEVMVDVIVEVMTVSSALQQPQSFFALLSLLLELA
jgi:hypothetical protein